MAKKAWRVLWRTLVALVIIAGWVDTALLPRNVAELPEALREWRALMPFSQTTGLIWFSGILAAWIIWIDLRPIFQPVLRSYIAEGHLRLFEVEWVQAQEAQHDGPAGRLWELRCQVRFVRSYAAPKIAIRVRSCLGTTAERTILASSRTLSNVQKDERLVVRFGSVWVPEPGWVPHQSVWGEELVSGDPGGKSIVMGCKNVVEIAIGRQHHRIFATTPTDINQPWNRILLTISQDEAPRLLSLLTGEFRQKL